MQINTEVWGDTSYYSTDQINKRTGVSSVSDQDYTDFPPFTYISSDALDPSPAPFTHSLYTLYALNNIELNEQIDLSICYVGMYNDTLPQLNIGVFYTGDTQDSPTFRTDNTQVQSYFTFSTHDVYTFFNYTYNIPDGFLIRPSQDWGTSQFPQRLQHWSDDAETQNYPTVASINSNLMIDPFLSFGIRSLFLVIYVVYISSYDSSQKPVGVTTTLNSYMSNTVEWKAVHPVMDAYALPYVRRNSDGSYGSTVEDKCNILPAFTLPLTGYDDGERSILQYVSAIDNSNQSSPVGIGCFPIYGNIVPTKYNMPANANNEWSAAVMLGIDKGVLHHNTNNVYWLQLDMTQPDSYEYLMRGCAAYGLFFSDDVYDLAQSGRDETRWIDADMCCGTINDEGLTNGDYTRGVLNALQRQWNWSDTTDSIYDPALPPVPENDYNTETVFNDVSSLATMTQRYAMTSSNVKGLGAALWTITEDLIDDGGGGQDYSELTNKILDTFLTNNPIDCIVNLRKYPFEIPKDDSTYIKLGRYTTAIAGYTVSDTIKVFTFRMKKKVLPLFENSFLDYEPYTHFELYVPFCGTVSLEPADILGRQLSVKLAADFSTGTCTAYILSDDLVIKTINGQIAIDIPVSGIQAVTAASQINNAIAQASTAQKQEMSATLGNVSVGGAVQFILNPVKTVMNAKTAEINTQRAEYELQHQNIQPHLIGSASSAASWLLDFTCRLLIYYPTGEVLHGSNPPSFDPVKLSEYGHTTGFACCRTGALSSFSGLTVAVSAALSGISTNTYSQPATLQELQMLDAALNEGVIL